MAPNPVQAVARASRPRLLRNALVAVAIVIVTAVAVTAGLIWPVNHSGPVSCDADEALVMVRPFVSLDMAERLSSAPAAARPGAARVVTLTGCVPRGHLVPVVPDRTDTRG